jgi:hypothetical protein
MNIEELLESYDREDIKSAFEKAGKEYPSIQEKLERDFVNFN